MKWVLQYLGDIKIGKVVLWCYLIWYVVIVYFYFDPSPKTWINALGISAVIGTGLVLSVSSNKSNRVDYWQTFRLYLMPFCVSSFSALIKDRGFIVFVSPKITETLVAISCCMIFLAIVFAIKLINKKSAWQPNDLEDLVAKLKAFFSRAFNKIVVSRSSELSS